MSETETSDRKAALERASALQRARRYEEALAVYRALAQPVLTVGVATGLGVCLLETGQFAEAEHWLGRAASARPAEPYIRRQLAALYDMTGRLAEAEREYRTALAAHPGHPAASVDFAAFLLSLGRYAEGWPLMEARAELSPEAVPPVNLSCPPWRGEPLAGKSVIVCQEQGLGDQIQFARFAQNLKAQGAAGVTLVGRPSVAALFETAPGADRVIPVGAGAAAPVGRHDFWTRYVSLPGQLRITPETIPARPYLAVPPERRAKWAGYAEKRGARVGLAWRASPTGFNARHKALPGPLADRILAAGAISLHPEDTGVSDFADTAAIVEQLDLVISIDTSVAHLAGAMGKPCWTLLPFIHCDWRWLRGRADSPWYPAMRLYRQPAPYDWASVAGRVLEDVAARAN